MDQIRIAKKWATFLPQQMSLPSFCSKTSGAIVTPEQNTNKPFVSMFLKTKSWSVWEKENKCGDRFCVLACLRACVCLKTTSRRVNSSEDREEDDEDRHSKEVSVTKMKPNSKNAGNENVDPLETTDWSTEDEVKLFYALRNHKPVGESWSQLNAQFW